MKAVLPIKMIGTDSGGHYCDLVHTLDIGDVGARLGSVRRSLQVGSNIVVQYRHRKSEFKVVWVKSLSARNDQWIGLRSVEQKDPWGIPRATPLVDQAELNVIAEDPRSRPNGAGTFTATEREGDFSRQQRQARPKVKVAACVCQPGSEDVVTVANMSRDGLCFQSVREYVAGTMIRVSAPYAPGTSNIFMTARVAWVRTGVTDMNEYGVNYVKNYFGDDAWG
jgi:hypothetical protein